MPSSIEGSNAAGGNSDHDSLKTFPLSQGSVQIRRPCDSIITEACETRLIFTSYPPTDAFLGTRLISGCGQTLSDSSICSARFFALSYFFLTDSLYEWLYFQGNRFKKLGQVTKIKLNKRELTSITYVI